MSFLGGNKQTLSTPDLALPGGAGMLAGRTADVQGNGLFQGPQGFFGGLGRIGDALAMAGGKEGVYGSRIREEDARNAFGQLISDPQNRQAFASLAQANPALAIQFMNTMKKTQQEPTNTEQVHDYILRTYGPQAADDYIKNNVTAGPLQAVPDPNNPYSVQYKTRGELLGGGAPPAAQTQSAPPSTGKGFADVDGASRLLKSLGPKGFLKWQQQYNVPVKVTSPADLANLPSGTLFIDPNGVTRRKN